MALDYALRGTQQAIAQRPSAMPALRDVLLELRQAQKEFGELAYESQSQVLSVQTDPIELEGIGLGPFRIELHLDQLGKRPQHSAIAVVALEPNPPTHNESVTHPHVSDEQLCTGQATAALESALASGRIADVFMLVRSVLTTYNPQSPYVSLDNWYGKACAECGYVTADEDELYTCQECDQWVCSECIIRCSGCEQWFCPSCAKTCPLCDEYCCSSCLATCDQCGRDLCHDCQVDGLCPDCQEQKEKQDEQEETQPVPELAPADALGR